MKMNKYFEHSDTTNEWQWNMGKAGLATILTDEEAEEMALSILTELGYKRLDEGEQTWHFHTDKAGMDMTDAEAEDMAREILNKMGYDLSDLRKKEGK